MNLVGNLCLAVGNWCSVFAGSWSLAVGIAADSSDFVDRLDFADRLGFAAGMEDWFEDMMD